MKTLLKLRTLAAAAIAAAGIASGASALTISFSLDDARGSVPMPTDVTLTDVTGGVRFTYAVDASVVEGDIIAAYFNLVGGAPASFSFSDLDPNNAFITAVDTNTSNVQGGNIGDTFDVGLAIGLTGLHGGTDQFRNFSFTMLAAGLDVLDFVDQLFAVRGQSIGADGDSAKQFGTATDTAPVPLPATGLLLIGGLGGMAALLRRRKA